MLKLPLPQISVCIPVFNTEHCLESCLHSVVTQDFNSFEVIVVSDCSKGKDTIGRNAKKICRQVQKSTKIKITFIEHRQNRGILEVRRTLFYAAHGKYITYVDSDDMLSSGALKIMYNAALHHNADIVHGTSVGGTFDEQDNFTPSKLNRYSNIFYGTAEKEQILHKWAVDKGFTANVWGKLIARDVYEKAFNQIPYTTCNLAEDFLMFFFIGYYAKKYVGIEDNVYLYREVGGMSSGKKVENLHEWKLLCSCASVFSIISTWLEENKKEKGEYPISEDVIQVVKISTRLYLMNNIRTYQTNVNSSIKKEAYKMMCDFWGKHFVQNVEAELEENEKKHKDVQNGNQEKLN